MDVEEPHLLAIVQAWPVFLFGRTVQMPHETDVKKILTVSPLKNWRRPLGRPRTMWISSRTWNQITSPWMKQLMWLRIDWCLRLALCAP